MRLVAATLVTTPPDDQELFIGGLSLIVDEKEWFRSEHAKEGLDPSDTVVKSQNREFIEWMAAKAASPRHADRAVALWAIESSYGHAWGDASPFAPPFDVTSQIWVSDSFKTYLREIERAAEDAIAAEGDGARCEGGLVVGE